jgi:putative aldouronate transport system permease protein
MNAQARLKVHPGQVVLYVLVALFSLFCVLPFVIILSSSMTKEIDILENGYNIFPKHVDFNAYRYLFQRIDVILNGYKITSLVTVIGTIGSLVISALIAYPLSLSRLKYRRLLSGYVC